MHKIITALMAGAFIIGVGVGHSLTMAAPDAAVISPMEMMMQAPMLRDMTVQDAV